MLFIDELQYVKEEELAALITGLHRTAQRKLPVTLVGAGLPQLRGRMGRAKSYAERLFDFPAISELSPPAARQALVKPALDEGVAITEDALERILIETHRYPYLPPGVGQARVGYRGRVADHPVGRRTRVARRRGRAR